MVPNAPVLVRQQLQEWATISESRLLCDSIELFFFTVLIMGEKITSSVSKDLLEKCAPWDVGDE